MRARFLIPGDINRKTGGYGYDRRVMAEAQAHGIALEPVALPGGFPFPDEAERRATLAVLRATEPGTPLLIDGLAFGAFDRAMLSELNGPVIALVHHPLAYENGLAADAAEKLRTSERQALARADRVIVTSEPTKAILVADFAVPESKIGVALPGTDTAPFAKGSGRTATLLLGVGSLTPRKAWDVLIDALALCADRDWSLTIAGEGPERAALEERIASQGLSGRVELAGEVSDASLARLYDGADLFIMPSLYEGFGMALTEAIARGLPAIASDGVVAIRHMPDETARIVKAGDAATLADAIIFALDPHNRAAMADHARAAAAHLPRWQETARIVADTIRSVRP